MIVNVGVVGWEHGDGQAAYNMWAIEVKSFGQIAPNCRLLVPFSIRVAF